MCEDDENFGWHLAPGYVLYILNTLNIDTHYLIHLCSASIKSSENQAVMGILLKEVKGLNPSFDGCDIRGEEYLCQTILLVCRD